MVNKYVIDTNVFIQSKNREYRFDFCGGFWDWITAGHADNRFFSCSKVQQELRDGDTKKNCPARAWADAMPNSFFLSDMADADVMQHYGTLMNWVVGKAQYKPAAMAEFADPHNADAFLVAVAKRHGMMLVTHEVGSPDAKSWVPIQSAADAIGVKCIVIYDLLSIHAKTTFAYYPQ